MFPASPLAAALHYGQTRWDPLVGSFFPWTRRGLSKRKMSESTVADTRRLNSKPQDLTDAYGPPSNFLEIDVYDPQTIGVGRNRYTTYEVRMRVSVRAPLNASSGRIWPEIEARGWWGLPELRWGVR